MKKKRKMEKKILWIIIGVVAVVLLLTYFIGSDVGLAPKGKESTEEQNVLSDNYGEASEIIYIGSGEGQTKEERVFLGALEIFIK